MPDSSSHGLNGSQVSVAISLCMYVPRYKVLQHVHTHYILPDTVFDEDVVLLLFTIHRSRQDEMSLVNNIAIIQHVTHVVYQLLK